MLELNIQKLQKVIREITMDSDPKREKCVDCEDFAVWTRYTQFSGSHPFCDKHAKLEKDFLEEDSYKYWLPIVIKAQTLVYHEIEVKKS